MKSDFRIVHEVLEILDQFNDFKFDSEEAILRISEIFEE